MTSVAFPAMGTTVEAWGVHRGAHLQDWFADCEDRFSRFLPGSELNRINELGGGRHLVSPVMHEILETASRIRELTDGLVDIGVGAAVRDWGYARSFEHVVDLKNEPEPVVRGHWEVDVRSVVLGDGVSLDLGGVAKGWVADRAVEQGLARVVSAGGDMRSSDGQLVADVAGPSGDRIATFRLGEGALATSSVARRSWRVGPRRVSHVVDPRTMMPVETPVLSASVVAATAVEAEAGAKAVLLHGSQGLAWADDQSWIRAALVVWRDGTVYATPGVEWAA